MCMHFDTSEHHCGWAKGPSPRWHCGARLRAASMVEVLIVVVIIAAIASLLVPAYRAGRSAADGVRVVAHLKQWGAAIGAYMEDWSLLRPPPSIEPLRAQADLQPLLRIPGVPWTPDAVDQPSREECPYLGDYAYVRYVHPYDSDAGFDLRDRWNEGNTPWLVSVHPARSELTWVPAYRAHGGFTCSSYEPFMISASMRLHPDGSIRVHRYPRHGEQGGVYFNYNYLFSTFTDWGDHES